jgi:hypothetical protein
MQTALRPIISRILASAIAALGVWLSTKYGITLDADTADGLLAVALFFFGLVYSIVHKVIDSKINPADAAKPDTVESTKRAVDNQRL